MRKRGARFNPSPAVGERRQSRPARLIAESLAAFRRAMSTTEKAERWRDRLWPRNYKCRIRAPERLDLSNAAR
jgi:hypothetical protein